MVVVLLAAVLMAAGGEELSNGRVQAASLLPTVLSGKWAATQAGTPAGRAGRQGWSPTDAQVCGSPKVDELDAAVALAEDAVLGLHVAVHDACRRVRGEGAGAGTHTPQGRRGAGSRFHSWA